MILPVALVFHAVYQHKEMYKARCHIRWGYHLACSLRAILFTAKTSNKTIFTKRLYIAVSAELAPGLTWQYTKMFYAIKGMLHCTAIVSPWTCSKASFPKRVETWIETPKFCININITVTIYPSFCTKKHCSVHINNPVMGEHMYCKINLLYIGHLLMDCLSADRTAIFAGKSAVFVSDLQIINMTDLMNSVHIIER